jgi:hypothetical protein
MLVNPLWHNGIIGSALAKMKQLPLVATVLAGLRWSVSPECLAFVQVRPIVLVTRVPVWNPEIRTLRASSIGAGDDGEG